MTSEEALMNEERIWHDARKERPEKSGKYVIAIMYKHLDVQIVDTSYSKKHDQFNVLDELYIPTTAIEPNYWTTLEEIGISNMMKETI